MAVSYRDYVISTLIFLSKKSTSNRVLKSSMRNQERNIHFFVSVCFCCLFVWVFFFFLLCFVLFLFLLNIFGLVKNIRQRVKDGENSQNNMCVYDSMRL